MNIQHTTLITSTSAKSLPYCKLRRHKNQFTKPQPNEHLMRLNKPNLIFPFNRMKLQEVINFLGNILRDQFINANFLE